MQYYLGQGHQLKEKVLVCFQIVSPLFNPSVSSGVQATALLQWLSCVHVGGKSSREDFEIYSFLLRDSIADSWSHLILPMRIMCWYWYSNENLFTGDVLCLHFGEWLTFWPRYTIIPDAVYMLYIAVCILYTSYTSI